MKTTLDLNYINGIIKNHKENSIYGRWIRLSDVEKVLSKFEKIQPIFHPKSLVPRKNPGIYMKSRLEMGQKKYLFGRKCMAMKVQVQKL